MIIRWGRKGVLAGALTATFISPVVVTTTSINEVQHRPSHKQEFRHITPVAAVPTTSIKRVQYRPDNRLEFRHLTPVETDEGRTPGGYPEDYSGEGQPYDLDGETGKQHLDSITDQLKTEFDLSPEDIEQIIAQAQDEGISLSDQRLRRLAQAVQTGKFEKITQRQDIDEDALMLILILANI